nr:MAG: structural polyprotein [Planococcus ficus-associated picorna-like virus 1]
MTDNLAPDETTQMNTTFLEERAVVSETTAPSTSLSMPPTIEQHMPDMSWMAKQQLMKPVQVSQVNWNPTDAVATVLTSFDFPEIYTSIESIATRTLAMYAYFKMSPVFRFQLNATQFHQGQLIISFDPFHQAEDPTTNIPTGSVATYCDQFYATGLPNVKIMASESDPAELCIPFIHPRNYLTTNSARGFDVLGRVRVQVLNKLRVATGTSPTLTLTTWIYAKDAEVHVPMNYHAVQAPTYHRLEPTSLTDDIGNVLKSGTNVIGNVATGNFGTALRKGQGLIDDLGKMLGFDYPTRPLAPEKTISPVENMAVCRGASRSNRLAVDSTSGQLLDSNIYGNPDVDMDFLHIAQTPMLLNQYTWSATNDPQSAIFVNIPVSPNLQCLGTRTNGTGQSTTYLRQTYLSFVSKFFQYWRGGITFDIEIIATRFHSGKLVLGFLPNASGAGATYNDIVTALPNITLDIQQTSKFSFTVPFVSPTALKSTRYATDSNDNFTIDECMTGFLYMYIQNRLTNASNVASTVDINLYIRAADDFQFFVPRATEIQTAAPKYPVPPSEQLEPTSSSIELQVDRSDAGSQPTVLSAGMGITPSIPRFGETYSMLDMIRRFQILDIYPSKVPPADYIPVHPLFRTVGPGISPVDAFQSYLSLLTRIYAGWTGSLRYKFVTYSPRTTDQIINVAHIPDFQFFQTPPEGQQPPIYQNSSNLGYAATLTTLSQDNCLEVEVPYYSLWNFLLTRPDVDDGDSLSYFTPVLNGIVVPDISSKPADPAPEFNTYYVYYAAGEDFRFLYLRSPPFDYNAVNGYNLSYAA